MLMLHPGLKKNIEWEFLLKSIKYKFIKIQIKRFLWGVKGGGRGVQSCIEHCMRHNKGFFDNRTEPHIVSEPATKKIPPYIEYNVYNGTLGFNLGGVSPLITDPPPPSSIPLSIFLFLFVIISKKSLNKYIKKI